MTNSASISPPLRPVRLRGRSFFALTLAPDRPVATWIAALDALVERSPGFFAGRAVVLDLGCFATERDELPRLMADLAARNIRIMAIESPEGIDLGPGLPPLVAGGRDVPDKGEPEAASEPPPVRPSLMLQSPVRSGQTIAYPQGDVIVLGSVASASEILAGGSIHVYGALRGRAIAGTMGDAKARIFCRKLEAELLSVDGFYMTADRLNPTLRGRAVQAWLDGDKLITAALD